MNIPYLDLKAVTALHGEEIQQAVAEVVGGGWYLQGEAVHRFEQHYAEYIGPSIVWVWRTVWMRSPSP